MKKKKTVMISLFAGIGGFDKAGEEMGWESVVICEIDPICRKVLAYHYPGAYLHGDIKTLTGEIIHHEIEKRLGPGWRSTVRLVLVGGFPCQPYSSAGKRLGKDDDRHLWPEMLRVIREAGPDAVVGENVSGILNWNGGLVFDEVQTDLENEGFQVASAVLPACGVNAPHRRDRVWFVANAYDNGHIAAEIRRCLGKGDDADETRNKETSQSEGYTHEDATIDPRPIANAGRIAGRWRWEDDQSRIRQRHGAGQPERQEAPDFVEGCHEAQRLVSDPKDCNDRTRVGVAAEGQGEELGIRVEPFLAVPHAHLINGHDPGFCSGEVFVQEQTGLQGQLVANTTGGGGQGDPSPWEQESQSQAGARLSGRDNARGYWDDWPTQSPVYSGDDGFSTGLGDSRVQLDLEAIRESFGKADPGRLESRLNKFGLKASGNAIVWQVVFQVFKALEATWED